MKKVIITGATSYLGVELARRLVAMGVEVHAIQRAQSNLKRLNTLATLINIHLYDGNRDSLRDFFESINPDVVFHLAGKYIRQEGPGDIDNLIAANIVFGSHLLEALRDSGVKCVVNTGSYFQFSNVGSAPINFYAACKNAFAEILYYYTSQNDFSATSLIIFDSYGPGDWRQKLFPAVLDAIRNNSVLSIPAKHVQLYPVYVSDVIDCFIEAAIHLLNGTDGISGESFAVRGDKAVSIEDVVNTFEEVSGSSISVKLGGWPANANLQEIWQGDILPKWQPKHSLRQGIQAMLRVR